jgi:hypothetical protein
MLPVPCGQFSQRLRRTRTQVADGIGQPARERPCVGGIDLAARLDDAIDAPRQFLAHHAGSPDRSTPKVARVAAPTNPPRYGAGTGSWLK